MTISYKLILTTASAEEYNKRGITLNHQQENER